MKEWILFAALTMAPVAAHAETFTFTSISKTIDFVVLDPPTPIGRPTGASIFSSSSKTMTVDGKVLASQGKCSSWFLPSGSPFGLNGVCHFNDGAGPLYDVAYTCELPSKSAPAIDCWGKLIGTGGAWKGRFGTLAWLSRQDGTNQGTGQWD